MENDNCAGCVFAIRRLGLLGGLFERKVTRRIILYLEVGDRQFSAGCTDEFKCFKYEYDRDLTEDWS